FLSCFFFFFFSSRRRHTRFSRDWSSDVCSSDLALAIVLRQPHVALPARMPVRRAKTQAIEVLRQDVAEYLLRCGLGVGLVGRLEIGRASCRERGWSAGVAGALRAVADDGAVADT